MVITEHQEGEILAPPRVRLEAWGGVGRRQRDPRIASRAPVLEAIVCPLAPNIFADYVVLAILHFLKDLPPFVDQLEALGMRRENACFVPVFYSRRGYVHQTLEQEGWRVFAATSYEAFNQTVRLALTEALNRAEGIGCKLLVLEDGGYVIPLLLREFPERLHLVAGAIEQTANGCWRDRDAERSYQTTCGRPLPFPVVMVGEWQWKKENEALPVANAILRNTEALLMRDHTGLRGKRVLIMGYGAIGSAVAEGAKARGALVGVFDPDPAKLSAAMTRGFEIPNLRPPPGLEPELSGFVGNYFLIIGTSGHCSIRAEMIDWLADGAYLVSGSSKQLEFDRKAMGAQAITIKRVDGLGTRYVLPSGDGRTRRITLLADGFPVNFWGDAESIPTECIEPVLALMLDELTRIARGENQHTGLCAPNPEAADRVARLYLYYRR